MNNVLDLKDQKILAELDRNARQSNSEIGSKVRLSKEVVNYRINRLIDNGTIIRFHTIINYFKLGILKYKLYLRITNINKEKLEEMCNYFYKHKNTEWVAITTGRLDIIIGFLVHNINEFDDEIQNVLNKFSNYIQEKAVTTTVYLAHQTRSFLHQGNKEISKVVYHTSKDKQEKIDKIDEEILKVMANNGRIPITELAKIIKTTPRIVQYRIKELEKKNIILAYKVHLDTKLVNMIFCKLIIYLSNVNQKRLNEFLNYASSLPGALWPQRVIGNWDFELDLEIENYDKFQDIILDLKEKFSDVIKNHDFCITSKEFKLDVYPEAYREMKLVGPA